MSEKESKDYFKKLMNDTQNKINDIDHNSNKLTSEPIEDYSQKKNSTKEEKLSTMKIVLVNAFHMVMMRMETWNLLNMNSNQSF